MRNFATVSDSSGLTASEPNETKHWEYWGEPWACSDERTERTGPPNSDETTASEQTEPPGESPEYSVPDYAGRRTIAPDSAAVPPTVRSADSPPASSGEDSPIGPKE